MAEFEDVCTDIRSILNSSKDQMTISDLIKDYETIIGSSIPWRKLGYKSLEDLLQNVPNLRLNRRYNETYLDLKPDEKTAHIAKLVQGQQATKKKGRKRFERPPPRRSSSGSGSFNNYSRSSNNFNGNSQKYGSTSRNYSTNFNNYGSNSKNYNSNSQSYTSNSQSYTNNSQSYTNNSQSYTNNSQSYNNRRLHSSRHEDFDFNKGSSRHHEFDSNKSNKGDSAHLQKYKTSVRTEYDFSDNDDDCEVIGFEEDPEDYESPEDMVSFSINVKADERKVPEKEFKNLSVTIGNSSSGAGRGNAILRGAASLSKRGGLTKSRENEVGCSSTNFASGDMKSVRDVTISSNQSLLRKTSPASILASGRAARNETQNHKNSFSNGTRSLFDVVMRNTLGDVPFKPRNVNTTNEIANPVVPRSEPIPSARPPPTKMIGSFQSGPIDQPEYSPNSLCQKLYALAIKQKVALPDFTNFHKVDPLTKKKVFMSQVKVGGYTFSSIPYEQSDLSQAQERAAGSALEELTQRFEKNHDSDLLNITSETQQIIERILEIVSKHPTGLKREAVEQKYRDTFHEKLPKDWLEIIKSCSLLSVETLVGGVFVYPPQDTGSSVRGVNRLPPLVLPEEEEWPIFITTSSSTTYVYFRIIGDEYNTKYDDLAQAMEDLYEKKKDRLPSALIVKEGNYYAAHLQGEWYRVKVLSPDLGETYRVSLVDHGDTDEVLKESIFDLEEEFTRLPAQAIRCGLTGLEQFHNNEYVTHTFKSMTESPLKTGFMARVDSRNPNLMISIFDTTTDVDININVALKEKMEKELSPPTVPTQSSHLVEVYLTRVKEDGGAHVQIISDGLKRLMSSMVEVKNEMFKHEDKYRIKSVTNLIGEKIILAKYDGDGMWHRAVVESILRDESAQVHFIDYGNIEIVPIEHLAVIKHFEYVLTAIPPQAVEVQFMKSTRELFTQTVIEFLMSLTQATNDEEAASRLFLMKVINSGPVPDVEFYLRDDNNALLRLNDIIGSFYSDYRGENFEAVNPKLDVSKAFPVIQPFPVPDSTEVLPVYVSMIVNPGHFVVQPLEYREELLKMTDDMRRYYTKERPLVDIHQIKVGNVFAVENDQKIWCRGRVIGVLKELSSVSFKCLDYLDIVTVDFKNIHPLMPCFRKLPALAIKAELAGITPIHNDWDMTDCLRFHELLAKKEFIGVIVDKSEDVVSMMLFDTSVQPEVDIGAILVEEKRAIDVTRQ